MPWLSRFETRMSTYYIPFPIKTNESHNKFIFKIRIFEDAIMNKFHDICREKICWTDLILIPVHCTWINVLQQIKLQWFRMYANCTFQKFWGMWSMLLRKLSRLLNLCAVVAFLYLLLTTSSWRWGCEILSDSHTPATQQAWFSWLQKKAWNFFCEFSRLQ